MRNSLILLSTRHYESILMEYQNNLNALQIDKELAELTHAQKDRLAFIDFRLQFFGHVARNDLIKRF